MEYVERVECAEECMKRVNTRRYKNCRISLYCALALLLSPALLPSMRVKDKTKKHCTAQSQMFNHSKCYFRTACFCCCWLSAEGIRARCGVTVTVEKERRNQQIGVKVRSTRQHTFSPAASIEERALLSQIQVVAKGVRSIGC